MFSLSIKSNVEKIARAFREIKLGTEISRIIEKLGFATERAAKKVTPVDTGRLRSSIGTIIKPFEATVAPHTHYAGWVHEGTRRMTGRPFLKWGWESASKTVKVEGEIEKYIKERLKV